jgi:hypothetical protein
VAFGFPDSARITVYRTNGSRGASFQAGVPGRTPVRKNYEAAVDEILAGLTASSERDAFRQQFLAIPMPTTIPAFRDILIDPSDRVWVVTSPVGDTVTQIEVHDTGGATVAHLSFPKSITLMDVTDDEVVGTFADSLGNQSLLVYAYH